jgi:hypothetical protein
MNVHTLPLPKPIVDDEGRRIVPVSPGVVLRSDRMVGYYNPTTYTLTPADVLGWYTPAELAKIASPYLPDGTPDPKRQVTPTDIVARLRAKWSWSDLRQPKGWERYVEARTKGIEYNGKLQSLQDWCAELGVSRTGLVTRLVNPEMPLHAVMTPGTKRLKRNKVRDDNVPDAPILSAKGYVIGMFRYNGYIGSLQDHCAREGKCLYTVRDRLRKGVPWPKAIEMRRKTRSDIGLPNPKRSIYAWDPGFVSRRDAAKQARQAMLEPVEVLTDEQRARARHNDRLRASLPPPPPNLLDAFDVGVPVSPSSVPAHDSSPAASAPPTHQNAA